MGEVGPAGGAAGQKGGRGMGSMPFFTNAVQMNLC